MRLWLKRERERETRDVRRPSDLLYRVGGVGGKWSPAARYFSIFGATRFF